MEPIQPDAWNFVRSTYAAEWFDGSPLGNGDQGALMLPGHKVTKFMLAKSSVWDERCDDGTGRRASFKPFDTFDELKRLIEMQQWDTIEEQFGQRLKQWKGKFMLMPAGALLLKTDRFEKEIEMLAFTQQLDMKSAVAKTGCITRVRRQDMEALVSVDYSVLAIKVRCALDPARGNPPRPMTFGMDIELEIRPKDSDATVESSIEDATLIRRLRGYHEVDYTLAIRVDAPKMEIESDPGTPRLTVKSDRKADLFVYLAIVSNKDCPDTKAEAIRRVRAAAEAGYAKIQKLHRQRWKRFWSASEVRIPETDILRQYHFGLYLLGSSSRKGFPMPGLQGLWATKHEGSGWNDYTNDLNIQMNYWPIYTSNHLELGWPYYHTVLGWLEELRNYTRDYYRCRGVQVSCCSSPTGLIPPGYLTTMHWAGHAAFVAQNFWTHYLYSQDKTFLAEKAYPMLKECALFYLDFLQKDKRGLYAIWPSNTPEAGEGSYEAWGKNPTMDIALLRMLFGAVIESTRILGCDADLAGECSERLEYLPAYPMRDGGLIDMESKEFLYSHRHNGMLTPIYPCADIEGKVAEKSLDRFLSRGKWLFGCHSVPWTVSVAARVGRGNQAREWLRSFFKAYSSPQGGFNLNFDYHRSGEGIAGPAVFCNESNSGFSAGLLDILLQSHNDLIRVFPAVPDDWRKVGFRNLLAEGAFTVSADRVNGKTRHIEIRSEKGGMVRLKNSWKSIPRVTYNGKPIKIKTQKQVLAWETRPGKSYKVSG